MRIPALKKERTLLSLIAVAVILTVISITAFEALMGLTLLWLLVSRTRFRVPPVWIPLALFIVGTIVSLAASGHFSQGIPQLRKFYVYLMLVLVTTVLQSVHHVRRIFRTWVLAAAVAATWGLIQFAHKVAEARQAHQPFYDYYIANRITGFTNHWMTFSGEMMIALLVTAAMILFGVEPRWRIFVSGAGLLITAALVGGWTRSMWGGAFCGVVYLVWFRKPWALLAIPPAIAIVLFANPFALRERVLSSYSPHGAKDSNWHRTELRQIGWKMIKAHPWLGVGPEQVAHQFQNYLPPNESSPLPGEYYGHLENDYIQYAAERGIPTMLALMWMIGWALRDFVLALHRLPAGREERWVLHAAVAAIIAVLVSGWDSWNLNNSAVLGMFLAVLGSGYVALWQSESLLSALGPSQTTRALEACQPRRRKIHGLI